MARTDSSLYCVLSFFIVIILCNVSSSVDGTRVMAKRKLLQGPKWCVAKEGLSNDTLRDAIATLCGPLNVVCSNLSPGSNCYEPNSNIYHVSWALNYYASTVKGGYCPTDRIGKIVYVDPSYGSCYYPPCTTC